MNWNLLLMFVNSSKVAGWTRAGVAAALTAGIAKWPWLSQYLDPATQTALGVAASGIAVGIWSHLAKAMSEPAPSSPTVPPARSGLTRA